MEHCPRIIVIEPIRVSGDNSENINHCNSDDRITDHNIRPHTFGECQEQYVSGQTCSGSLRMSEELKSLASPKIWRPFAWDINDESSVSCITTKSEFSPNKMIPKDNVARLNFIVPGSNKSRGPVPKRQPVGLIPDTSDRVKYSIEDLISIVGRNTGTRKQRHHNTCNSLQEQSQKTHANQIPNQHQTLPYSLNRQMWSPFVCHDVFQEFSPINSEIFSEQSHCRSMTPKSPTTKRYQRCTRYQPYTPYTRLNHW